MSKIKAFSEVENQVKTEVAALCMQLDELFPGYDVDGITSNFQAQLEIIVLSMLQGHKWSRNYICGDSAGGYQQDPGLPVLMSAE